MRHSSFVLIVKNGIGLVADLFEFLVVSAETLSPLRRSCDARAGAAHSKNLIVLNSTVSPAAEHPLT